MATANKETKQPAPVQPVPLYEQEKKAREEAEEATKEARERGPIKPQAQIDAERAGDTVPPEEQGYPTEARRWLAVEREREERADFERFKTQYAHERDKKLAAKSK